MEWDYSAGRFWLDVLQLGGVVALGVYTWVVNRTKVNRTAIRAVEDSVGELSRRVSMVETDMRHLPQHSDMGELHEKVNAIANSIGKLEGELDGVGRTLSMINQHLLNGG